MVQCVYKSSENLVHLYNSTSTSRSRILYGSLSPHYVKDKVLNRKNTETIYKNDSGLKNAQYEDKLRELKLWTFEGRRVRADLIEAFTIVIGLSSIKLETFFELDNKGITRGHQWKLKKKRCNTDNVKYFSRRGWSIMWNNLHQQVVSATSINYLT